jgi:hypothetical protein
VSITRSGKENFTASQESPRYQAEGQGFVSVPGHEEEKPRARAVVHQNHRRGARELRLVEEVAGVPLAEEQQAQVAQPDLDGKGGYPAVPPEVVQDLDNR